MSTYEEQGFTVLRRVVDPAVAASQDDALEAAIPGWARECGVSSPEYLAAVCRWGGGNPVVARMAEELEPVVERAVVDVLDRPVRRVGRGVFRKSAAASAGTHAHQDAPYGWNRPEARYAVTSWVALTPTTAEQGALEVLPRSHRTAEMRIDFLAAGFEDRRETPTWREHARTLSTEPGDVVLFDSLLWHASSPTSGGRRTSLALRWATDDAPRPVPTPNSSTAEYGMDTCGTFVDNALRSLSGRDDQVDTETLVEAAVRRGVLGRLPTPAQAEAALRRYLLLRQAGRMHAATAQRGMVWEDLREHLTRPALGGGL